MSEHVGETQLEVPRNAARPSAAPASENTPAGYPKRSELFREKTSRILQESEEKSEKADRFLLQMERLMQSEGSR
jgi:hypothetical protein